MSNDAFARRLGIGVRTVASWHELPDRTPNTEMQQILTSALEKAPAAARNRFAAALQQKAAPPSVAAAAETVLAPHTLKVAIAIVRDDTRVLLVQRRGSAGEADPWQFPAGMVKPGLTSYTVAVRETLAETGVHCAPTELLGSRIHPITNVLCDYILCEYLGGEAENRDAGENVGVAWATTGRLTHFIPADRIFPPVLQALGVLT